MEWRSTLAAIQIPSVPTNTAVHVVDRYRLGAYLHHSTLRSDQFGAPAHYSYRKVQTYCGLEVDLSILDAGCEREGTDVNCEQCVTQVEKTQAFWHKFYSSPEGRHVLKLLSGHYEIERQAAENHQRFEAVYLPAKEFADLLSSCLKHQEPVFTLELPDEILLKLVSYGSVGEVLLAFKLNAESRKRLETKLGKAAFSLLGSRLISKGYLKPNDPTFHNWNL